MAKWFPNSPKQIVFLSSPAYEGGFGGAKGGGKSECILAEAERQVHHPRYKAIIFRRTTTQLDEIWERSKFFYSGKARMNEQKHTWRFPSGAVIKFAHCQHEKDKEVYNGHEYQFMAFDQVETFTETQYKYLIMQNRTSDPSLRCYVRVTMNPGGIGHAWVKRRFIDCLDHNGKIRWFRTDIDEQGNDIDVETTEDDPKALSRCFVFSNVYDNKHVMENDPEYVRRLESLPEKMRRAYLKGDWDAFAGQYFETWRKEIHVIDRFDRTVPHTLYVALDYGYSNFASVGWYAVLPEGFIIRYRELYVKRHTYEALGKRILEMSVVPETGKREDIEYIVADPAIWGDQNYFKEPKPGHAKGESGFDLLNKGINETWPIMRGDNRRIVGWGRCRDYLEIVPDQFGEKRPKFAVTRDCRNFIRTVPSLVHDDSVPEDLDTDGEDHPADEWRYGLMSRPDEPRLPEEPKTSAEEFWETVNKDIERYQRELDDVEDEHEIDDEDARELEG